MIICVDVSEMIKVNFLSGIQRVVKEITIRWIRDNYNIRLLAFDENNKWFNIVDNEMYFKFYTGKSTDKNMITNFKMCINEFNSDMIFFDIDSVWMNPFKRSYLLPLLKKHGTKIAAFIHDIIPVTESQYCDEFTTLCFLEYIGAELKYSDIVITSTQATVDAINELIKDTNVKDINGHVVKFGSDITKKNVNEEKVRNDIKKIADKNKYVLMVGTIEPRKNHKFVLDAFDKCLFDENINLIFAGRVGWNVDELMNRIENHPRLNKQFFYISDANDQEISYLYEKCSLVAFPSFNEGFGLPIIEAINRNTPVIASDIPVLREVGIDCCKYFSLEDNTEFIELVRQFVSENQVVEQVKEAIQHYVNITWDECAENMCKVLTDF